MVIHGKRTKINNKEYSRIYNTWKHMMDRCYNPSHKRYKDYGGKGCFVCDRWHNLDNFIDDFDKIKGYSYENVFNKHYALDKDAIEHNNKEYCLEKCVFISLEENNKYKPNQQKEICGISPDKNIFIFYNQSEFAKQNNLKQSCISDCLRGKCKTHKGWMFYYNN